MPRTGHQGGLEYERLRYSGCTMPWPRSLISLRLSPTVPTSTATTCCREYLDWRSQVPCKRSSTATSATDDLAGERVPRLLQIVDALAEVPTLRGAQVA